MDANLLPHEDRGDRHCGRPASTRALSRYHNPGVLGPLAHTSQLLRGVLPVVPTLPITRDKAKEQKKMHIKFD